MDKLKVVEYQKREKEEWKLLRILLAYGVECEISQTYERINKIIEEINDMRSGFNSNFYRIKCDNTETIILVDQIIVMQIENCE